METYKVTFEDGNHLVTGFNGTLEEAKEYYLNNWFEFDEIKPTVKGKSVEKVA